MQPTKLSAAKYSHYIKNTLTGVSKAYASEFQETIKSGYQITFILLKHN